MGGEYNVIKSVLLLIPSPDGNQKWNAIYDVRVRGVPWKDLFHPWVWKRGLLADFSSSSSSPPSSCSPGPVCFSITHMRKEPQRPRLTRKINLRGYYSRISHLGQNSISVWLLSRKEGIGGCWSATQTSHGHGWLLVTIGWRQQ